MPDVYNALGGGNEPSFPLCIMLSVFCMLPNHPQSY